MESMPHSAALIAGGKSTRMGRDKAALLHRGVQLWRHQLATLAATAPAEVFIAGKCAPAAGVEQLEDSREDCGPLGGLASALRRASTPWLLVLAVDMPMMTPSFLSALIAEAGRTGRGVVPVVSGEWEPLAAVYPVAALPIAEAMLARQRLALRHFIEAAQDAHLVQPFVVENAALFANWNTPGDITPG
jgi:molybdenum cofactor guanylyltransferase